ncbi:MAG: ribbon-helix-helix protein, CopG family [Syntrophobacteraceae bacterium]
MDFRSIAPGSIDLEDRTFEIRAFGEPSRLRESLARFGILDPLWIMNKGAGHIVVDGFKRLRWAVESGFDSIHCRVFPEDFPLRELHLLRIQKRLFQPDLNLAEKVQIAAALLRLFPPEQIPRPFLGVLNISSRLEILQKWARLGALEDRVLQILATGEIAERAALAVSEWDSESRDAVLPVLQALRCSASIQQEIIERIDEIAVREGKSRSEILSGKQVEQVLSEKNLNHRRKTQALRDVLTLLRYPRLSARESHFEAALRALAPPSPVRIIPPPAFEGNNWRMELAFSGPEELREVLDSARNLASSNGIDLLFHPPGRSSKGDGRE